MDEELIKLLKKFINEERHHITEIILDNKFEIVDVKWDYKHIDHDIHEETRCEGYKKVGHHTCKNCGQIVLHLLGENHDPNRICLECGGYERIPKWYYYNYKVIDPVLIMRNDPVVGIEDQSLRESVLQWMNGIDSVMVQSFE